MIVVFSPAMPPLDSDSKAKESKGENADPFESFGRAIGQKHARVSHVAYVPAVGYTDKHRTWTLQAHAIITIVCEPPVGAGIGKRDDSIANQQRFSMAVSDTVRTLRTADGDQLTMSALYCGEDRSSSPSGYQNLVHCPSYTKADLKSAAGLLMGC